MRRLTSTIAVLLLALTGLTLLVAGGGRSGGYVVAAQFDNSGAIVAGEDVEVAGAVVGTVQSLGLTKRTYKAVLDLRIDNRRFVPFHQDASCTIRSQGVLAVEFVDCAPGTAGSPPLPLSGGVHVLNVQHTSSPIEFDLVTNIMREPAGEYLQTLLDELGTGLAAQGSDLGAVIRRANPGLAATDQVLQVLAQQNRALAQLAGSADRVLAPLAAERTSLAGFIATAQTTAAAPAAQAGNVERSIARLPGFLAQLRPTLAKLGTLADAGLPVIADLRATAPGLDTAIAELRPFAQRAIPATASLGRLTDVATPALRRARPLIAGLQHLAAPLTASAQNLSALTASFEAQAGLTHLLQLLFYSTNAVNGFDAGGHYARVELLSGACSEYTAGGYFGCASQFGGTSAVAKPIKAAADQQVRALLSYLFGARP